MSSWCLGLALRIAMPGRHFGIAVASGAALRLGTRIVGSVLVLDHTRQTALSAAEATPQNSALAVASEINRELLQVGGALVSLPALFSAFDRGGSPDAPSTQKMLQAVNHETFSLRDLLLVRDDGTIWAQARRGSASQPLPLTLTGASAAAHPGAVTADGPTYNATTGEWSWYLSRAVSLTGIGRVHAVAEMPLRSITALLAPVGAVPGLRIYIERPDGRCLASFPYDGLNPDKPQVAAVNTRGPENVAFRLPARLLTQPAIAVWRSTLYPDVRVAAVLDLTTSMAGWAKDRDRLLAGLSVACLLILALAGALYAAFRQRDRVETERKHSRQVLESTIEAMSDGFVMWDQHDRLLACSQRFGDFYAITAPYFHPGARFADIVREGAKLGQYPQAGNDIEAFVHEMIDWHHGNHGSTERLLPDGRWILVTERINLIGGIVGIRTDVTVLKQTQAELAEATKRANQATDDARLQNVALLERERELHTRNMLFTAALNNMSQGLLMVDADDRVIVSNKRFRDIFKIAPPPSSVTAAQLFTEIVAHAGLSGSAVAGISHQQEELATSRGSGVFVCTDDERLALSVSQRPLPDGGWIATYQDVTERQRSESRIRFMAHHDMLTGLPNRAMFSDKMAEALKQLNDDRLSLALLFLDLDRFKLVNDTLGHPAGDTLIKFAAQRLQGRVRDADIVARLGGDEFAILYLSQNLPAAATAQAQRIVETLSESYHFGHRKFDLSVSIGISFATSADVTGETFFRNADMALYQAKACGRGSYCIFEPDMEVSPHARLASESDLRLALEKNQFEVYYQPLFDLRSDQLRGFEALLRWNHATRGLITPDKFIPLAEELGFVGSQGGRPHPVGKVVEHFAEQLCGARRTSLATVE